LLVDSDRILSAAFALESLKTVAPQGCQVVERVNRSQSVKLEPRSPLGAGQRLDTFPGGASRGAFAPIADDHASTSVMVHLEGVLGRDNLDIAHGLISGGRRAAT
jgi:hypothetical protein